MNDVGFIVNHPRIKIQDTNLYFPVTRVFGIGRNYSENVAEENKDDKKVVLFMKDAYMLSNAEDGIEYPNDTNQLRYEIELIVAIGKQGENIKPEEVDDYIFGYAVGIDFTKYDVQEIAKKNGWPWDQGKSFIGCAPCSSIKRKEEVVFNNNRIWLDKNKVTVQEGTIEQMIWSIKETISLVSSRFDLRQGDLIFTGTPSGVGMTDKNDTLEGGVDGINKIKVVVR